MQLQQAIESKETVMDFSPIPDGWYAVKITNCTDFERKQSMKNPNNFFSGTKIEFTITGYVNPDTRTIMHTNLQGRKIWDNVILFVQDQYGNDVITDSYTKMIKINRDKIGNYSYAGNIVGNVNNTDMLIGAEMVAKIASRENKNDSLHRISSSIYRCNKISDYKVNTAPNTASQADYNDMDTPF